MLQIRQNDIDHHRIEPEFHNQNPCEGVIREFRKKMVWYDCQKESIIKTLGL